MYLESLHLVNFKNYIDAEVLLSNRINCFVGINGVGKTNILDAVHYLSVCKSYMNSIDRQNIRFEQSFFVIQGVWSKNKKKIDINCAVKVGAKKVFRKNKKEYEKLANHIGQFPAVMISPYDRDLILEGSNLRRKWMDGIISQFDRNYLEALQRYSKVLAQRNAVLKDMNINRLFDQESIDIWDVELVRLGNQIYEKRKVFLEEFIPVFQKHYDSIGSEKENVRIIYKSQLNENTFEDLLLEFQKKDLITSFSNAGVHKDDLLFQIKNHPVKKFGSQGQQKSFIIALRLAQYEWLKTHLGVPPILLLDDIFDKLDQSRVKKLINLVANNFFGQVLVTDTDLERIQDIFSKSSLDSRIFLVADGKITKYQEERAVHEKK
ncbi:MAG: DNA replication and repair protein RecF [Crocinitomicaceae bacterium]|nr:DNA replication and repair protein RecF [Crocinitomicaceae bacterium]|tara:strand:+ start:17472 stop:18605 length:1134 start_codon:yes stop_codon:yes gene_type:complete